MLHIDVQGRGPALVLLHGWGLHGGVFALLRARLEPHFTVHCVDLPGHGHSRHVTLPADLAGWAAAVADQVLFLDDGRVSGHLQAPTVEQIAAVLLTAGR